MHHSSAKGPGCDRSGRGSTGPTPAAELTIVCTFFPAYVFTRNIAHDISGVRVESLVPSTAGCPHDYEMSTRDAKRLARADILVAVGGIDDALVRSARDHNASVSTIVALAEASPATPDRAEAHDHAESHPWVSPRRAVAMVRTIADRLAHLDPERGSAYLENAAAYVARLERVAAEVAELRTLTLEARIVTVHDAFDPLAEDLGVEIVASIRGAHGADPSPRDLHDIVRRIRDRRVVVVFGEPQFPQDVARQIAREAGVPYRLLDPVASGPPEPPLTWYEDTMRANLRSLAEVLSP